MTPDPIRPKAKRKWQPPTVNIPVELDPAIPHGCVILIAVGDKIERIIARHEIEIEAFNDGAQSLKVLVAAPTVNTLSLFGDPKNDDHDDPVPVR